MSFAEAVVQRYSVEKVLLEISKNSQKITCARVSFLIKWQTPGLQLYEKETLARVFSCGKSLPSSGNESEIEKMTNF